MRGAFLCPIISLSSGIWNGFGVNSCEDELDGSYSGANKQLTSCNKIGGEGEASVEMKDDGGELMIMAEHSCVPCILYFTECCKWL
ncbi:hypothetical protein V8C37DRAFT_395243 [Trichoderma ceciliae]